MCSNQCVTLDLSKVVRAPDQNSSGQGSVTCSGPTDKGALCVLAVAGHRDRVPAGSEGQRKRPSRKCGHALARTWVISRVARARTRTWQGSHCRDLTRCLFLTRRADGNATGQVLRYGQDFCLATTGGFEDKMVSRGRRLKGTGNAAGVSGFVRVSAWSFAHAVSGVTSCLVAFPITKRIPSGAKEEGRKPSFATQLTQNQKMIGLINNHLTPVNVTKASKAYYLITFFFPFFFKLDFSLSPGD